MNNTPITRTDEWQQFTTALDALRLRIAHDGNNGTFDAYQALIDAIQPVAKLEVFQTPKAPKIESSATVQQVWDSLSSVQRREIFGFTTGVTARLWDMLTDREKACAANQYAAYRVLSRRQLA